MASYSLEAGSSISSVSPPESELHDFFAREGRAKDRAHEVSETRGKLQKQPSMASIDLRSILPGGSLSTALDELAAFGQMYLNDGIYDGKRILSEASVTEMRRLQSLDRSARN